MIKLSIVLKNKKTGELGTLEYSFAGGSVHCFDGNGNFIKTLGDRIENILTRWDAVDLPEGYEVGEYGEVRKIKE